MYINMYDFITWINFDNTNYFLTKKEIETDFCQKIISDFSSKSYFNNKDYYMTHSDTIDAYFKLDGKGTICKCIDYSDRNFSDPKNLPDNIVEAIKSRAFDTIGLSLDLLSINGKENFDIYCTLLEDDFKNIVNNAYAEYDKAIRYVKQNYIDAMSLDAKTYSKKEIDEAVCLASNEYDKIKKPAQNKREKITSDARCINREKSIQIFWDLFENTKNRSPKWR